MGENQGNREFSGIETFLSIPENIDIAEILFNETEKLIYHKVNFGVSIQDSDIYELGRYIGRVQVVFGIAKEILMHSKNENATKEVGKRIIDILNDLGIIFVVLANNVEMNRFNNIFSLFKEDVDDFAETIIKYISV
jgi:hypothetical protein